MNIKKYISYCLLFASAVTTFSSCSDDKFTDTIFPDGVDKLDPNSATYKLDKWLKINYTDVYNLDFRYKMQDVGADMNYNLVPATYDKAIDLSVLVKYLWYDAYKEVAGQEFLKEYGPRIIHLIGSAAKNPSTGTEIVGLAEGGIKVSLFKVNEMDINDFNSLNENYFKTMHHEFTHILHQTKSYPTSFNLQSNGHYDDNNWQNKDSRMLNSLGFVTPYASSQYREDVAETVANYIVKTDEQWNQFLLNADKGWETPSVGEDGTADSDAKYYCFYYYDNNEASDTKKYVEEYMVVSQTDDKGKVTYYHKYLNQKDPKKGESPYTKLDDGTYVDKNGNKVNAEGYLLDENGKTIPVPITVYAVEDKDGVNGREVILNKLNILRIWLQDEFGVSIDAIRAEVQKRQLNYNITDLRKDIDNMQ